MPRADEEKSHWDFLDWDKNIDNSNCRDARPQTRKKIAYFTNVFNFPSCKPGEHLFSFLDAKPAALLPASVLPRFHTTPRATALIRIVNSP